MNSDFSALMILRPVSDQRPFRDTPMSPWAETRAGTQGEEPYL